MNKSYSSLKFGDNDEYPEITADDVKGATFRVGLKPAPRRQEVTILLDVTLLEYLRGKADDGDFDELINNILRKAVTQEALENTSPVAV